MMGAIEKRTCHARDRKAGPSRQALAGLCDGVGLVMKKGPGYALTRTRNSSSLPGFPCDWSWGSLMTQVTILGPYRGQSCSLSPVRQQSCGVELAYPHLLALAPSPHHHTVTLHSPESTSYKRLGLVTTYWPPGSEPEFLVWYRLYIL